MNGRGQQVEVVGKGVDHAKEVVADEQDDDDENKNDGNGEAEEDSDEPVEIQGAIKAFGLEGLFAQEKGAFNEEEIDDDEFENGLNLPEKEAREQARLDSIDMSPEERVKRLEQLAQELEDIRGGADDEGLGELEGSGDEKDGVWV